MDTQTILNATAGVLLAIGGWIGRQIWDAVSNLRKDLHELERGLPREYVSKHDFDSSMKRIEELVGKIFDKLDGKEDKRHQR